MEKVQVIIGIPGKWKTRTELIQAVASKSEGYLMAGYIIHNAKKDVGFQVEVYEHDPDLRKAFAYAGRDSFVSSLLDEIEQHTFTVYIIADVSDFEDLKEVVDVGIAFLKAGGLAVKIESSGIAHTKEEWYHLDENKDYFSMYSHFVTLVGGENGYYSCGMKAFGLPDAVIPSSIPIEEAANLLNSFNLYHLTEKPTLRNGDTFSLEENVSIYKIQVCDDFRYEEDDAFFNPFGLLDLVPFEKKKTKSWWKR